jgi:hypothetical protein
VWLAAGISLAVITVFTTEHEIYKIYDFLG